MITSSSSSSDRYIGNYYQVYFESKQTVEIQFLTTSISFNIYNNLYGHKEGTQCKYKNEKMMLGKRYMSMSVITKFMFFFLPTKFIHPSIIMMTLKNCYERTENDDNSIRIIFICWKSILENTCMMSMMMVRFSYDWYVIYTNQHTHTHTNRNKQWYINDVHQKKKNKWKFSANKKKFLFKFMIFFH